MTGMPVQRPQRHGARRNTTTRHPESKPASGDRTGDSHAPPTTDTPAPRHRADGFADTLTMYRTRRLVSQSATARRAGLDHSYVSRLESGTRVPTRDAVLSIAQALGLDTNDTDTLLASAGYVPTDPVATIRDEPAVVAAYRTLQREDIDEAAKTILRLQITLAVDQIGTLTLTLTPPPLSTLADRELNGTEAA